MLEQRSRFAVGWVVSTSLAGVKSVLGQRNNPLYTKLVNTSLVVASSVQVLRS